MEIPEPSPRLQGAIFELSREDTDWKTCCREWQFVGYIGDEVNCVCGVPIVHNFSIHNTVTGSDCVVGSVCIAQFAEGNPELYYCARDVIANFNRGPDQLPLHRCRACNRYTTRPNGHKNQRCQIVIRRLIQAERLGQQLLRDQEHHRNRQQLLRSNQQLVKSVMQLMADSTKEVSEFDYNFIIDIEQKWIDQQKQLSPKQVDFIKKLERRYR